MGSYRLTRMDKKKEKALKAVEKESNQLKLEKIAREFNNKHMDLSSESAVRCAALRKLTDQLVIADIAKHAGTLVGDPAIEILTDQAALAGVAKHASSKDIRKSAVKKLTDQAAIKDLVLSIGEKELRILALNKLTDQSALEDIVKNDTSTDIRLAAVGALTDQKCLLEFALGSDCQDVRKAAALKITNRSLVEELAKNCADYDIRIIAYKKLFGENECYKNIVEIVELTRQQKTNAPLDFHTKNGSKKAELIKETVKILIYFYFF